jgi:D-threo-aldose 1-dehydrogenase
MSQTAASSTPSSGQVLDVRAAHVPAADDRGSHAAYATPVVVGGRFGLGCSPLAGLFAPVTEEAARATIDRAWELGVRFFDTAPLYGHGVSERRTGAALAGRPRDEFVLATKVGRLLRADAPPDESLAHEGEPFFRNTPAVNPTFDFSYDGALRSLEESLERLGLDRVDIVHIHDSAGHADEALAGAYRALDRLRSEGVIRKVGAGMLEADVLARFAREADFDCFLFASRYTLLQQDGLDDLFPLCEQKGIEVIIGGVYNSGILAAPDLAGTEPSPTFDYKPAPPELLERTRRLATVCERHGVPLKAAAVQLPLGQPAVATVLVGCRSPQEVDESLRMFETPVPADLWAELRAEGLLAENVPTCGVSKRFT